MERTSKQYVHFPAYELRFDSSRARMIRITCILLLGIPVAFYAGCLLYGERVHGYFGASIVAIVAIIYAKDTVRSFTDPSLLKDHFAVGFFGITQQYAQPSAKQILLIPWSDLIDIVSYTPMQGEHWRIRPGLKLIWTDQAKKRNSVNRNPPLPNFISFSLSAADRAAVLEIAHRYLHPVRLSKTAANQSVREDLL